MNELTKPLNKNSLPAATLTLLIIATRCFAQGRVDEFLGVKSWQGVVTITGSGAGSTSGGPYSDVWKYSIDSATTILLPTVNANIEGWTGTFNGGASISASDVSTAGGCTQTLTQTGLVSLGVGKTFTMHLMGTNQYVFYPSDYIAQGGTNSTSNTCAPGVLGGPAPVTWAPVLSSGPHDLPATGFSLKGSETLTLNSPMQPLAEVFGGTPAVINVTVEWDFEPGAISAPPHNVTVSTPQVTFTYTPGGTPPPSQNVNITSSGNGSFSWTAGTDSTWIHVDEHSATPQQFVESVQPAGGVKPLAIATSPGILTVSIDPTGLSAGPHAGHVSIYAAGAANSPLVIPVSLTIGPAGPPVTGPTRTISHIANGGGWRTTGILINTGTQAESFELKFWDNNGSPLPLDLGPDGVTADLVGAIQPGVARFIRTAGTGNTLQAGWAELTSPLDIDGNSIFGLQTPGQGDSEAAVPLSPNDGTQLYIPFDYSTGYSTGIAFADPGQTLANVTATILDDTGANIPAAGTITVHARGHFSDVLADPFTSVTGKRGVAHFTSTANIFGLGIRANGKAFTSIDALSGVTNAAKTIPHIANGGGWKTTFLIVCTDTHASNFTLKFWHDDGTPLTLPLGADGTVSSITATLQPGEIRIVQTTDTGTLVTGWAELSGLTGAIGGTAIFALQSPGQSDSEAAVPFATASSTHLFMPYDYSTGYSTGIALTNTGQSQATVTATFTDAGGHALGSGQINVPAHGHNSAVLGSVLPAIAGTRGTVSLTSSVPIFGLGIRANGLAFTSLKVIAK